MSTSGGKRAYEGCLRKDRGLDSGAKRNVLSWSSVNFFAEALEWQPVVLKRQNMDFIEVCYFPFMDNCNYINILEIRGAPQVQQAASGHRRP